MEAVRRITLSHAARWSLSALAAFGPDGARDVEALAELARHGLIVATPNGAAISRKGFAALPAHEQEQLRSRWNPPTRAECERDAAMWRRLET